LWSLSGKITSWTPWPMDTMSRKGHKHRELDTQPRGGREGTMHHIHQNVATLRYLDPMHAVLT
jgi:hypothetical protein